MRHDDRAAAGRRRDRTPLPVVLAACGVLLLITMTAGVGIGSVALSPAAVWQVIAGHLSWHAENTVAGDRGAAAREGRPLNALAMGAEPAASLGVDVPRLRRNLFFATSLLAGVAVAVVAIAHVLHPAAFGLPPDGS